MHHYCQEGKNSSAKGSEIVEIVLDKKIKRPDLEKNNEITHEPFKDCTERKEVMGSIVVY